MLYICAYYIGFRGVRDFSQRHENPHIIFAIRSLQFLSRSYRSLDQIFTRVHLRATDQGITAGKHKRPMVGNRIDIQHPRLKESGVVSKNQDEACRLAGCIALQWKFVRFTSGSRNFLAGPYLESEGRGVRASICFEAIYTGEKRGVARALSSPIEVSFFIGRELILRR